MGDDDRSVIPIDPDLAPGDLGEPAIGRARTAVRRRHGRARPDVLAVIAGSFLLGLLMVLLLERFPPTRLVRPFLATGILGAFTTMSTYEVETALLIKNGHPLTGIMYGVGSLVVGLALAYMGIVAGRLTPARHSEARR
jgi:fluoride ion exporter CrcB/FEX